MNTFGKNLDFIKDSLGINQTELANFLEIPQTNISRWINSTTNPALKRGYSQLIQEKLNVEMQILMYHNLERDYDIQFSKSNGKYLNIKISPKLNNEMFIENNINNHVIGQNNSVSNNVNTPVNQTILGKIFIKKADFNLDLIVDLVKKGINVEIV